MNTRIHSTHLRDSRSHVVFATLSAGALGSATVALIFLGVDAARGDVLFTPGLLGSAFFLGIPPAEVAGVRMDMVAAYSLLHLLAFTTLSGAVTLFHHSLQPNFRRPVILAGALFSLMTAGIAWMDATVTPGVLAEAGLLGVLGANGTASAVMAWFIHATLQAGAEADKQPARLMEIDGFFSRL